MMLAWVAHAYGDRVGLMTFNDHVEFHQAGVGISDPPPDRGPVRHEAEQVELTSVTQ
jgi:hypothetical protein